MPKAFKNGNSSMGKSGRGLLEVKKSALPGPGSYNGEALKNQKADSAWSMPKKHRDGFFAKYGQQNETLIARGLV